MRIRTFAAIGAFALAVAACGSPDAGGEGGNPASAESATPAALGQVIKIGDAEYTVTGVQAVQSVGSNPYLRKSASDGATFVVVNWTMKNAGTRPMEFYDQATMHLVDPAGVEYSSDDEATITYGLEADLTEKGLGDLNPGITSRGADVYEVSSTAFNQATWTLQLVGSRQRVSLQ